MIRSSRFNGSHQVGVSGKGARMPALSVNSKKKAAGDQSQNLSTIATSRGQAESITPTRVFGGASQRQFLH